MTMIERVARAIEAEHPGWEPRDFDEFVAAARASIRELQIPTAAMLTAGMAAIPMTVDPIDPRDLAEAFQAMIAEALTDDGYEA